MTPILNLAKNIYLAMEACFPERASELKFSVEDCGYEDLSLEVSGVVLTSQAHYGKPDMVLVEMLGVISNGYWDPPEIDVVREEEVALRDLPMWFVEEEARQRVAVALWQEEREQEKALFEEYEADLDCTYYSQFQ